MVEVGGVWGGGGGVCGVCVPKNGKFYYSKMMK